jgi:hypothetical protein
MNKENIREIFSQFDRDEFANWLWNGLRSLYASRPSDRVNAFQHVGWQILQYESVDKGLARFYEEYVPDSRQLLFRQAIGDVLRRHANDHDAPLDAIRDLIYLITRIKADESLSALYPTVCNGYLAEQYPGILYDAITILRSRAPSEKAYKTASNLIDCANFEDGYLFEAIKVLVECEPSYVSRILIKYEERLSKLFRDVKDKGGDEWVAFCNAANEWTQFLLEYAPLTWLSHFWEKAAHSSRQLWLFKQIYCNEAIPTSFCHDRNSDRYFIRYMQNEVQLKVSKKDRWTRDGLSEKSTYDESNQWSNHPDNETYSKIYTWINIFNPKKDAVECPA